MVRRYELMVIFDPNQPDEAIDEQVGKLESMITAGPGGEIINIDRWGKKRLAYEIGGRAFGYYVVYEFMMEPNLTAELERQCRIDANNLRHLLLVIPEKVLTLKEREKELKVSLDDRRRRLAEESEEDMVVDMLTAKEGVLEDLAEEFDDIEPEVTPKSDPVRRGGPRT